MKRIFLAATVFCFLITLCACGMEAKDLYSALDGLVEDLGDSQITRDQELIGVRTLAGDPYTGSYQASCTGDTGRDVIFGGASVGSRKLYVHGTIQAEDGQADVRIRLNREIQPLSVSENGSFQTVLELESGGNYIMIDYHGFTGKVKLMAEYQPDLSAEEESSCTENYAEAPKICRFPV